MEDGRTKANAVQIGAWAAAAQKAQAPGTFLCGAGSRSPGGSALMAPQVDIGIGIDAGIDIGIDMGVDAAGAAIAACISTERTVANEKRATASSANAWIAFPGLPPLPMASV